MARITVQINFLGPFIKKEEISKIIDFENNDDNFHNITRDLLGHFFNLPIESLTKEILERYIEITTKDLHMPITPHTKEILERLLKPLKSAKKNYCLGDYSATIALCGLIGEMLTILIWKINDVYLKNNPISEKDEKGLFGRSFEKLNQDQRLKIIKTFSQITQNQYDDFCFIRDKRNIYLHLWSTDLSREKNDALNTLKKSFRLFKDITKIGLADARSVKINPLMLKLFKGRKKLTSHDK